jgi:hypothetical protein
MIRDPSRCHWHRSRTLASTCSKTNSRAHDGAQLPMRPISTPLLDGTCRLLRIPKCRTQHLPLASSVMPQPQKAPRARPSARQRTGPPTFAFQADREALPRTRGQRAPNREPISGTLDAAGTAPAASPRPATRPALTRRRRATDKADLDAPAWMAHAECCGLRSAGHSTRHPFRQRCPHTQTTPRMRDPSAPATRTGPPPLRPRRLRGFPRTVGPRAPSREPISRTVDATRWPGPRSRAPPQQDVLLRATAPSFRHRRSRRPRPGAEPAKCCGLRSPAHTTRHSLPQRCCTPREGPACETLRHHARTRPELPTASRSYRGWGGPSKRSAFESSGTPALGNRFRQRNAAAREEAQRPDVRTL